MKNISVWAIFAITLLFPASSLAQCLGPCCGHEKTVPVYPWFVDDKVDIDPKSLPPGVTVETEKKGPGVYKSNGVVYTKTDVTVFQYFKNSTNIPLFINLPGELYDVTPYYPRTQMLVAGQVYRCQSVNEAYCTEKMDPTDAVVRMKEIKEISAKIAGPKRMKRPENVAIPKPEEFKSLARYGDKEITIRGTLSFALDDGTHYPNVELVCPDDAFHAGPIDPGSTHGIGGF